VILLITLRETGTIVLKCGLSIIETHKKVKSPRYQNNVVTFLGEEKPARSFYIDKESNGFF
jgi:hypothetical protein